MYVYAIVSTFPGSVDEIKRWLQVNLPDVRQLAVSFQSKVRLLLLEGKATKLIMDVDSVVVVSTLKERQTTQDLQENIMVGGITAVIVFGVFPLFV